MSGQRVYLTASELDKLRSLYGIAWSYYDSTYLKLTRALDKATEGES